MDEIGIKDNLRYNGELLKAVNEFNKNYDIEYEEEEIDEADSFLLDAIEYVIQIGQVSTSYIQRRFKIGYTRAAKIIDQMEERGIMSGYLGGKPRKVLIILEEWNRLKDEKGK